MSPCYWWGKEGKRSYKSTGPYRIITSKFEFLQLDGICQLRLDFDYFYLDGPEDEDEPRPGLCLKDALKIHGVERALRLPPLCGDISGHHGKPEVLPSFVSD